MGNSDGYAMSEGCAAAVGVTFGGALGIGSKVSGSPLSLMAAHQVRLTRQGPWFLRIIIGCTENLCKVSVILIVDNANAC